MALIDGGALRDFDLVYLSRHDTPVDRRYANQLGETARSFHYLHLPPVKPDIRGKIQSLSRFRQLGLPEYREVFLASLNAYAFRKVLAKNRQASVFGFDDGTANIFSGSLYFDTRRYKKSLFYEKLLGLPSVEQVKNRIQSHYSIFPGFENIIEADRLSFVSLFSGKDEPENRTGTAASYFIGQPFSEYLDHRDLERLRSALAHAPVDHYLQHPREIHPLLPDTPRLADHDLIAEDAIFQHAAGQRPTLVGGFSTVLFNIPATAADKVMFLSEHDPALELRGSLARRAGCEVRIF